MASENSSLPEKLSNPAKRALAAAKVFQLLDLEKFTYKQIYDLHGIGPNAMKILESEMAKTGIKFKDQG